MDCIDYILILPWVPICKYSDICKTAKLTNPKPKPNNSSNCKCKCKYWKYHKEDKENETNLVNKWSTLIITESENYYLHILNK